MQRRRSARKKPRIDHCGVLAQFTHTTDARTRTQRAHCKPIVETMEHLQDEDGEQLLCEGYLRKIRGWGQNRTRWFRYAIDTLQGGGAAVLPPRRDWKKSTCSAFIHILFPFSSLLPFPLTFRDCQSANRLTSKELSFWSKDAGELLSSCGLEGIQDVQVGRRKEKKEEEKTEIETCRRSLQTSPLVTCSASASAPRGIF